MNQFYQQGFLYHSQRKEDVKRLGSQSISREHFLWKTFLKAEAKHLDTLAGARHQSLCPKQMGVRNASQTQVLLQKISLHFLKTFLLRNVKN